MSGRSWAAKKRRYHRWVRYYMRYPRLTRANFSVPWGLIKAGNVLDGADDYARRRRVWTL